MGVVATIGFGRFPKQGSYKGQRVRVCFNRDFSQTVDGTVIRDDDEAPHLIIIQIDDGRVVLSTECQWSPIS